MSERNAVTRSLHDVGLGAWPGGSPAAPPDFADVQEQRLRTGA